MIQTIRLNEVLRETTRYPVRDLVTRPTGAAIRLEPAEYQQRLDSLVAGSEAR